MKKLLTSAVFAAATMASMSAMAELSANAALTTDYMWRGVTQSDNGIAVQGGADWTNEDGIYAGVWASTIDFGPFVDSAIEFDFYAGKKFGNFDVGLVMITVDDDLLGSNSTTTELKLAGSFGMVNAELDLSLDTPAGTDYTYLTANADFDVDVAGKAVTLTPYLGTWGGDASGTHFGVTASHSYEGFDISATIDIADKDLGDDTVFFLTASKGFEL